MSGRKLFGVLSGAQVTLIASLAIVTPGAVYAVAYTSVVITEPNSGRQAFIDSARRLFTYDPIQAYSTNPANIINLSYGVPANQTNTLLTEPAGVAFVIKSINMTYSSGTANFDNHAYVSRKTYVAGTYFIAGFDDPNIAGAHSADLGSGFVLRSGEDLVITSTVPLNMSIEGYQVPSTALPAAAAAVASAP
jgi:hypothetical protein